MFVDFRGDVTNGFVRSSSTLSTMEQRREKKYFLLFVKLLVQLLDREDPEMQLRVKETVTRCAKEHRRGNPQFVSLSDSTARELKLTVGNSNWKRTHEYLTRLISRKWSEIRKREQLKNDEQQFTLPTNSITWGQPSSQTTRVSSVYRFENVDVLKLDMRFQTYKSCLTLHIPLSNGER